MSKLNKRKVKEITQPTITSFDDLDWLSVENNCIEEIEGVEYITAKDGSKLINFINVNHKNKKQKKTQKIKEKEPEIEFIHVDDFVDDDNEGEDLVKTPLPPTVKPKKVKKAKINNEKMDIDVEESILVKPATEPALKLKKESNKPKPNNLIESTPDEIENDEDSDKPKDQPQPQERSKLDMSAWSEFNLDQNLLQGLKDLKFSTPTEIQLKTLPFTLNGQRDILGAAQTGSGKTLAFGLPILQDILSSSDKRRKNPTALILVPTRELAMQVTAHLKIVSKNCRVRIISIVGGLSQVKQQRLLTQTPDIIVATPGRLWDLCQQDETLIVSLLEIRFLVFDEADRMLEAGHYKDLDNILEAISLNHKKVLLQDEIQKNIFKKEVLTLTTEDHFVRRTFLFSATLLPDAKSMIDNGKQKHIHKKKKKKLNRNGNVIIEGASQTMADLVAKIEFADPNPVYVNLVIDSQIVAKGLIETKLECLLKDKDIYLYYVLLNYPGRTLIFVNSIDNIRRLVPLLTILNVKCWGIHSDMQQRQRLKNLERFTSSEDGVLISSDVSARGLDIPSVDHVIHYQLPRTADLYVHRSGRTARGVKEGVVIAMVCPEEIKVYKRICFALKKEEEMAGFPVDHAVMPLIRERVAIAKTIDELEHKLQKETHDDSWLRKTAEDADIVFEEEMSRTTPESKKEREKLKGLKFQLKGKMGEVLLPKGMSRKYVTIGLGGNNLNSGGLADVLLSNFGDGLNDRKMKGGIPAKEKSSALSDIKKKVFDKIRKRKVVEGDSE